MNCVVFDWLIDWLIDWWVVRLISPIRVHQYFIINVFQSFQGMAAKGSDLKLKAVGDAPGKKIFQSGIS